MIKQFTIIICTLIIHCLHGQNMTTYILCEGNFGSANSSLWAHNFSSNSSSPIHWDENSNPLGDVGQSLTIHDDKLFIIMNNSHTVEIMDLGNVAEYSHTINLPNASPRYMYAENNIGYISSWGLNAIIVMDLSLMELVDTIQVHGMPEHIINYQEYLYVSVPSKSDWSTNDKILKINKNNHIVEDSLIVEPGPSMMVLNGSFLYVSSSSYDDSWNRYAGTTKINLNTNEIIRYNAGQTSEYGSDLFNFENKVYQSFDGGIVPLNDDLSADTTQKIGNFSSVYSAGTDGEYIYFGLSDYVAPDTVVILNSNGALVNEYVVGAIPGSFAFYETDLASVSDDNLIPDQLTISNFPNPFNPTTNIQYNVEKSAPYKLYISDINGRIIKDFKISNYTNGKRITSWNASQYSSGIYFAILEQGNNIKSIKLSLIK